MLMCREATRLCSDELERPLRVGERMALKAHTMMCSGCANYREQLAILREACRHYAEGHAAGETPAPDAPAEPGPP